MELEQEFKIGEEFYRISNSNEIDFGLIIRVEISKKNGNGRDPELRYYFESNCTNAILFFKDEIGIKYFKSKEDAKKYLVNKIMDM